MVLLCVDSDRRLLLIRNLYCTVFTNWETNRYYIGEIFKQEPGILLEVFFVENSNIHTIVYEWT